MRRHSTRAPARSLSLILILTVGTQSAIGTGTPRAEAAQSEAAQSKTAKPKSPMTRAGESKPVGGDAFARALYGELAGREGNLAVSPASIEACVLLALAGARGSTADEIAKALRLGEVDAQNLAALLDRARARVAGSGAEESTKNVLTIANSAWVQRGFPIHDAYRKLLEEGGATFETVDFEKASDAARGAINAWVERETNDKIAQLFGPGSLDASTRLVLANAVYFKGLWRHPFDKQATKPRPFRRPGMAELTVPTMHQEEKFRYLENENYQAVELPYDESAYSMVVWLPRKLDGLAALEKSLVGEGLEKSLAKLGGTKVDLYLPRFKVDSNLGLVDVLGSLGMKQAFTPAADFSGITSEPLWISAAVHQALVEVDEEGTEAAAATGLVAATAALVDRPTPVFRADHPFLFAIRNIQSGDVLFMGRVVTPEK
jgi:serine protease inhibitor